MLDPATHGHGRWCVEVMQGLGLLGRNDAGSGARGAPPPRPLPHVGMSLGGAVLLDLVRPAGWRAYRPCRARVSFLG